MDNDNKIKKLESEKEIRDKIQLFLSNELVPLKKRARRSSYDLEKEYAKTRRNRSYFIPLVLSACFIVIGLMVAGTFYYISRRDNSIKVNIRVFDDVNTKGLLDSVSRLQSAHETAQKKHLALSNDLNDRLENARKQLDFDFYVIESMNLESKADIASRKSAARAKYHNAVKALHLQFDEAIAAEEAKIKEYKEKLSTVDKNKIEAVQKESGLDSERLLQRMEMDKLSEDYESRIAFLQSSMAETNQKNLADKRASIKEITEKYQKEIAGLDPVIKDSKADQIIKSAPVIKNAAFDAESYIAAVPDGAINDNMRAALNNMQKKYSDYEYLYKTVASIPQKNSVPSYVSAGRSLALSSGNEVAAAAVANIGTLYSVNRELVKNNDALNEERRVISAKNDKLSEENSALAKHNSIFDSALAGVLSATGKKAVVLSSSEYRAQVYVTAEVKQLAYAAPVPAELIDEGRKIKGMIQFQDEDYYFIPDVPEGSSEGTELVSLSSVIAGSVVEISENN